MWALGKTVFLPLLMVLFLAVNIGIYLSGVSLVADRQGWTGFDLAVIFFTGGAAAVMAYLFLGRTAPYTIRPAFFRWFGAGMALVAVTAGWLHDSYAFWLAFAAIAGLAHTHFYHGIRLKMAKGAEDKTLMRLFSLKYIMLCAGNMVGVTLVQFLSLQAVFFLMAFFYVCIFLCSFAKFRIEADGVTGKTSLKNLWQFIQSAWRAVFLCALCGVLGETFYYFVITMHLDAGFSEGFSLQSYNILMLGAVLLQYPLAGLQDKNTRHAVTVFAVLGGLCFAVLPLFNHIAVIGIVLFILGGLMAALSVVGDGYICKAYPEKRSTALQVAALAYLVGHTVCDPVAGAALDMLGRAGLCGVFVVVMVGVYWGVGRSSQSA
ncbi:MAG: hypothetical protein OXT65_07435 [Alphaproteobacteria bacterium]|nr:hypothetical protein [Alphaproteobacteria bacterium]